VSDVPTFDEYLASLSPFAPVSDAADPDALSLCQRATSVIADLGSLTRSKLAQAIASDPHIVPVYAAAAGLSQERFKTWLTAQFQTAGWVTLGRDRPEDLVAALDDNFDLLALLEAQAARSWTWADVLARTMAPRQRAGTSVQQGRDLEDTVEARVNALGLEFEARTRFHGKGGATAPADFAIPDGAGAVIAVAVKGFDSTGSKLSDATREIEQMVEVKTARQYIFAVVDGQDGQGWLRRQGDLRRIHALWTAKLIDGLYTRAQLGTFEVALKDAARRLDLI
jgi:hypothetical protein